MKPLKLILICLFIAFLTSCGSGNDRQNFELGTLEIVDYGNGMPDSWQTHITVNSTGIISGAQYSVEDGIIAGTTHTWEHQMTTAEKDLIEQQSNDANILYGDDVTLPDGAGPCTGAGNLTLHAISSSGLENRFLVSGDVRCVPFVYVPAAIMTLFSTITGWTPVYAQ